MPLDQVLARVTDRIRDRSRASREPYLSRMAQAVAAGPARSHLSCGNQAHAYAAMGPDKDIMATTRQPNRTNLRRSVLAPLVEAYAIEVRPIPDGDSRWSGRRWTYGVTDFSVRANC